MALTNMTWRKKYQSWCCNQCCTLAVTNFLWKIDIIVLFRETLGELEWLRENSRSCCK
jgi:hypothetical protein